MTNKKIVVIGAGEIGKNALAALFKVLPKDQKIDIILLNRNQQKAEASYMDAEFEKDEIFFCLTSKI